MALAPEFIEATANSNLKNVAEAPAFYSAIAMANATAHQQAMQQVQLAAVGKIVKYLTEPDIEEASASVKMASGNDLAQQFMALLAAIATGQQGMKGAQTTPPDTGT